jgi:tetratricopeptide (TPR) repeat protein
MSPLDQLWTWVTDNAEALGVAIAALAAIIAFFAWRWPRNTDPPPGGQIVYGPKVGRDVGSDAVGRDKTTVYGDQVGRDKTDDRFQGHNITAKQVIIQQAGEAAAKAAVAAASSRFQLPGRNPDFEGRREKIEEIKKALRMGAAQLTSLEGMGGIGKTHTAVEAAHDLVDEGLFKDAQLFLDLQGFSATGHPLAPADALRRLLRPFVAADEILPESEHELAGLFREAVRGLAMLLFLDNARDDAQVEPLFPGHSTCVVLVTSRNQLALRGLKPIDVALMSGKEATALALKLANRRDPARITTAQAEEIARLCGYLPLSIEMTANALAKSRGAEVASYLKKLGERTMPLGALDKVKAVLALSVGVLDPDIRARWPALGVFEGGFDAKAAAAVWAVEDPAPTLEELEHRSLVTFESQRYRLHDLLRAVALEELARERGWHKEVMRRHADYFYAALKAANELCLAGHDNIEGGLALVDAQLGNIRAAQRWAADAMADDRRAAELAQGIPNHGCLTLRLSPDELVSWLETAFAAAEQRGDSEGQSRATGNLGIIYRRRGNFDLAEARLLRGLAIDVALGRKEGISAKYTNLVAVYLAKDDLDRAEEMLRKSLALAEELGSRRQMATNYGNLALIHRRRGELDSAEEMHKKSLAIEIELGRKEGMAAEYGNLGLVYEERGDLCEAVASIRQALAFYRELGARTQIEQLSGRLRKIGVDPDRDEAA